MAITTINQMVKVLLPYLTTSDDEAIELWKQVTFLLIQPCTGKVSPDLEDEDTYNLLQKALVADVVALQMLVSKSIAVTTGSDSSQGSASIAATFLKKAKAGSAEAEFDLVSKDNYNMTQDAEGLYNSILQLAKAKAAALGCSALSVLFGQNIDVTIVPPFRVFPSCR